MLLVDAGGLVDVAEVVEGGRISVAKSGKRGGGKAEENGSVESGRDDGWVGEERRVESCVSAEALIDSSRCLSFTTLDREVGDEG